MKENNFVGNFKNKSISQNREVSNRRTLLLVSAVIFIRPEMK